MTLEITTSEGNKQEICRAPSLEIALSFPVLLANHTSEVVFFKVADQPTESPAIKLCPKHSLLYSWEEYQQHSIRMGLEDKESEDGIAWSAAFSTKEEQHKIVSVMFSASHRHSQYLLSINPSSSESLLPHTTQISIRSRFCLVNRTSLPLRIAHFNPSIQEEEEEEEEMHRTKEVKEEIQILEHGEASALNNWFVVQEEDTREKNNQPCIAVRISLHDKISCWGWSRACWFSQERLRQNVTIPTNSSMRNMISLQQKRGACKGPVLLTYSVLLHEGVITMVLWRDSHPPFQLLNCCPFPLLFSQHVNSVDTMEMISDVLLPSASAVDYAWTFNLRTVNEDEHEEDKEQEEETKKHTIDHVRRLEENIFVQPTSRSNNRLCFRTFTSSWSDGIDIDSSGSSFLLRLSDGNIVKTENTDIKDNEKHTTDHHFIQVETVSRGSTNVVCIKPASAEQHVPLKRRRGSNEQGDQNATKCDTRSIEGHEGEEEICESEWNIRWRTPVVSLRFLDVADHEASEETSHFASIPLSIPFHSTLAETVHVSLDNVHLSLSLKRNRNNNNNNNSHQQQTNGFGKAATSGKKFQSLLLEIGAFQVDNHMPLYGFPVVALSATDDPSSDIVPSISCSLARVSYPSLQPNNSETEEWFFDNLSLRVGKGIVLNVEYSFVQYLLFTARSLISHFQQVQQLTEPNGANRSRGASQDEQWIKAVTTSPLFVRNLFISKINVELSVHANMALSLGLAHTPLYFDEVPTEYISSSTGRRECR